MPVATQSISTLSQFRRNPIGFLRDLASSQKDLVPFQIGRHRLALLTDPELIAEVLVTQQEKFVKGPGLLRARPLLGNGLLTQDGPNHREQRKRLQPAFHRRRIEEYVPTMAAQTREFSKSWKDGEQRDIHGEMMRLTLRIVTATLFESDQEPNASEVAEAIVAAMEALYSGLSPGGATCPHGQATKAVDKARDTLETVVAGVITSASNRQNQGFLDLLLDNGNRTSEEIRDEALTFFLAGHESVANALSWTWFLLSQHPDAERRFHTELDTVLQGQPPHADDLEKFVYTRAVLSESMRLYPPAWMVSREARADVRLGEHVLARGTIVVAAPCVTHVDPRFWPDPDRFLPERWLTDSEPERPRFAYFPFGGGMRVCIGERFAWTELLLVLATVGQRWRLTRTDSLPLPEWLPLVTLRPRDGVPMVLQRRG